MKMSYTVEQTLVEREIVAVRSTETGAIALPHSSKSAFPTWINANGRLRTNTRVTWEDLCKNALAVDRDRHLVAVYSDQELTITIGPDA